MNDIEELQKVGNNQTWLLDEFVILANKALPKFLVANKNNDKISDEVNARLVRHYTTQRMLDEPEKVGRNAVYTYRHLLQLLVVRRLLSQSIPAAAIGDLAVQRNNTELESILAGKAQLNFTPASIDISWSRIEITQGLELNIRSDFNFNAETEEQLLVKIAQALKQVKQRLQVNQISVKTMTDEALNKKVQEMFENFTAFFNHPVSKERQQEWEESKKGWHYHALIHITYWVLRDRHNLNDTEAKAEITNQTKQQLDEKLLKVAPELGVTVQQVFERFTNIFGHQVIKRRQEEWEQSADGWERMALRHVLYWIFRKRELEHEEAWLLTDKPIPQLKKRLLELAPELYKGEMEQMIDHRKIKWTKNVNAKDGERWAYYVENVGSDFKLHWKNDDKNINNPQKGELIILRQHTKVTHLVEVLDDTGSEEQRSAPNDEFSNYRLVKIWWKAQNFDDAPNQNDFFEIDGEFPQSGKAISLEKMGRIKERFGSLESFQKHVITVLGLEA